MIGRWFQGRGGSVFRSSTQLSQHIVLVAATVFERCYCDPIGNAIGHTLTLIQGYSLVAI